MAGFTYSIDSIEYNGGAIGIFPISITSYSAPTVYSDYYQLGATDGVEFNYKVDSEKVFCDQAEGMIDVFRKMSEGTVTVTAMQHKIRNLAIAFGVDFDSALDVSEGNTDHSFYSGGSITTTRVNFGGIQAQSYYDLQFLKPQSHDTGKVIGFRLPKVTVIPNIKMAHHRGDKGYYQMTFEILNFDLDESQPYYKEFGYLLKQTA